METALPVVFIDLSGSGSICLSGFNKPLFFSSLNWGSSFNSLYSDFNKFISDCKADRSASQAKQKIILKISFFFGKVLDGLDHIRSFFYDCFPKPYFQDVGQTFCI